MDKYEFLLVVWTVCGCWLGFAAFWIAVAALAILSKVELILKAISEWKQAQSEGKE